MADITENIDNKNQTEYSFWDHLEVLRWSIMRILIALGIGFLIAFFLMPSIFDKVILAPSKQDFFLYRWLASIGGAGIFSGDNFSTDIININVASQFMTHISTSLWVGLMLVFPYLIWEVWRFISPALYINEKRSTSRAFIAGTLMFYLGAIVGYCVIFPFTFRFLTEYQLSEVITNQINLASYMNNFVIIILTMGVTFEIPILAWLLSKAGLISKAFLKQYRRHAIVLLLILAAVITPTGDPFTLAVVFLPLYLLYEISIKIVH